MHHNLLSYAIEYINLCECYFFRFKIFHVYNTFKNAVVYNLAKFYINHNNSPEITWCFVGDVVPYENINYLSGKFCSADSNTSTLILNIKN